VTGRKESKVGASKPLTLPKTSGKKAGDARKAYHEEGGRVTEN